MSNADNPYKQYQNQKPTPLDEVVVASQWQVLPYALTKREQFAVQALNSLMNMCSDVRAMESIKEIAENNNEDAYTYLSRSAVRYADALIAELNKEVGQ